MGTSQGGRGTRPGIWLAALAVALLFAWLGWYGYEDRRTIPGPCT